MNAQVKKTAIAFATLVTLASGGLFAATLLPADPSPTRQATPDATGVPVKQADADYSPPVRNAGLPLNLYWGDTHLHTRDSADAYSVGNEHLTADDAFRFARGGTSMTHNGMRAKLRRPLDFLAVTDHAEYLGIFERLSRRDPALMPWKLGRRWAELLVDGQADLVRSEFLKAVERSEPEYKVPRGIQNSIWSKVVETADRYNDPGRFTAFIGYEWTSMIEGDNLHRVVLYKDGADKAARGVPFSAQDSLDPEKLWAALDAYQKETGGEALAIPHNGNVSNGRMFAPTMSNGKAFTASYARARARWEPVIEVTQVKGDSETHPTLSPTDEFADFERWDRSNLTGTAEKKPGMVRYEYARSALREGLRHASRLGTNPFKFGLVGGTDAHIGLSTHTEDNFWGKTPSNEPGPKRVTGKLRTWDSWQLGASGLTAVWASENTREALFAAFKRREVYATTGSRIQVHFFGGYHFSPSDVNRPDYATIGYRSGVPMGGDLLPAPAGAAPVFMVFAAKDPDEANLDRIQIIKGWLDGAGRTHEKIYDVALSDGRTVSPRTGKAPPVGSTVDLASPSYTNSIGDPELSAVWRDPDFRASERAFYYVRVLEIPKPRWTAYDASFYKLRLDPKIPMTVQDRAYTSPIWYQP